MPKTWPNYLQWSCEGSSQARAWCVAGSNVLVTVNNPRSTGMYWWNVPDGNSQIQIYMVVAYLHMRVVYIHTRSYKWKYTYTYIYTRIYTRKDMHTYTHIYTYTCTYIRTYINTYIHIYIHILACINANIYNANIYVDNVIFSIRWCPSKSQYIVWTTTDTCSENAQTLVSDKAFPESTPICHWWDLQENVRIQLQIGHWILFIRRGRVVVIWPDLTK